ncbi:MAG: nitroreductase family protein [Bacillota bacterium]|jgi:nitroreductase
MLPEQVLDLIKARRSVRKFEDRPLTDEQINMLLEAMRWAPSGGNRQPWAFYVVKSPKVKQELIAAAKGQTFIAEAAIVIGVVAVTARSAERYGERGEKLYALQDTAAAVQNCLLLAKSMGLGSCWIGAFKEDEVAQVLGLPEGHRPVALIPIGHPAEEPAPRPKMELKEVATIID